MIAQSIMTENPACCTVSTPLRDVAKMMIEFDCGEIPVISGDGSRKPVGVITDRDIATRIVANGYNPQEYVARELHCDRRKAFVPASPWLPAPISRTFAS